MITFVLVIIFLYSYPEKFWFTRTGFPPVPCFYEPAPRDGFGFHPAEKTFLDNYNYLMEWLSKCPNKDFGNIS